jgi:hypothetical protein
MPRVSFLFAWYDFWVGVFWDRTAHKLYILPMSLELSKEERDLVVVAEAAGNCTCPPDFPCLCARNLEWAERKLEELRQQKKSH